MTPYTYAATLLQDVDGDTVKVSVKLAETFLSDRDLGFHCYIESGHVVVHETLRLLGINAPEHGTVTGDAATAWLKEHLVVGTPVTVQTVKDRTEKYGRYLATVYVDTSTTSINAQLVAAGHALPWDGRGVRPV